MNTHDDRLSKRSLNLPPRYRLPGERVNWPVLAVWGVLIAFWAVVYWVRTR